MARDDRRDAVLASKPGIRAPLLSLMLLSPTIAELLTGSSPPDMFFNPVNLAILVMFYGAAAALARDAWASRGLDSGALLLLGAAYGVWEEGLSVASFFNPDWKDLGVLKGYGRVLGLNTVWAAYLTLFHSFYSIALPALFLSALYPDRASARWLSPAMTRVFAASVVIIGLVFHAALGYPLSPVQVAACLIVIAVLLRAGLRLTSHAPSPGWEGSPLREAAWWLGWSFALFVGMWVLPSLGAPPLVSLALSFFLFYAAYRRLRGITPAMLGSSASRLWGVLAGSTAPIALVSLLSGNLVAVAAYLALLAYLRAASGRVLFIGRDQ